MASNERGVAWRLWEYIDRELYKHGRSQKWLAKASGVSTMTINRLRTQPNPPKTETVHALADALGLDRDEAGVLAGRLHPRDETAEPTGRPQPPDSEQVSVRDAVIRSDVYTEDEKRTLLGVIDALDAANQARRAALRPVRPDDTQQAI